MALILIATAESAAKVGSLKAGFAGRLCESNKLHIYIEELGPPPLHTVELGFCELNRHLNT